jgi:predicted esterase
MITSHNIKISKSARYFSLGELNKKTKSVWFVLHGYGQSAQEFLGYFKKAHLKDQCVIAPEGLSRFYEKGTYGDVGASWMTKEDRLNEIDDYVNYLDCLCEKTITHSPEVSINVLGFSQGVATASRWVTRGKVKPNKLVLWAGSIPPDLNWTTLKNNIPAKNTHFVYGQSDPFIKSEHIEQFKLLIKKNNYPLNLQSFEGKHQLKTTVLKGLFEMN